MRSSCRTFHKQQTSFSLICWWGWLTALLVSFCQWERNEGVPVCTVITPLITARACVPPFLLSVTERDTRWSFGFSCSKLEERKRTKLMGERFVVVPVDGAVRVTTDGEHPDAVAADYVAASSDGGEVGEDIEAGDNSVSESQSPDALVPILEYNREPNKYGKTGGWNRIHAPPPPPRLLSVSPGGLTLAVVFQFRLLSLRGTQAWIHLIKLIKNALLILRMR